MSSTDFSHYDSYKGYVNSVLNSFQERSVPDPVWGQKLPANYEELRQHCLSFVDKYTATPSILPGQIVPVLEPYTSTLPDITPKYVAAFQSEMISEIRIQKLRK
jgi:hypothetical protein